MKCVLKKRQEKICRLLTTCQQQFPVSEAKIKLLNKLQQTLRCTLLLQTCKDGCSVGSCLRSQLRAVDGVLSKQDAIVIPQSQREDILNKIEI